MPRDTSAVALPWERCWTQQAIKSSFPLRCSGMKSVSGKQWIPAGQGIHFLVQPRQQEIQSATYGLKIINSKEKEENLLENNLFVGNGLSNDLAIECKYSHRQKNTWKVSLLQQRNRTITPSGSKIQVTKQSGTILRLRLNIHLNKYWWVGKLVGVFKPNEFVADTF